MTNAIIGPTMMHYDSGVKGAGPALWYDTPAPDGDANPWLGAPVGSIYIYKPSTTAATGYFKSAANGVDADWVDMQTSPTANGALIQGKGSSTTPTTTAAANKNFLGYWVETTATTAGSDTRGMYLRLYSKGATTGGSDALRAYNTLTAAVGTAHGAHISLGIGTGGSVSGQGEAIRGTLELPAGNNAGTLAAIQGEIWLSSATSAITGTAGIFRASVGGDTTLAKTVKNLIMLDGVGIAAANSETTNLVTTGCADGACTTKIRILVNGTTYYLMATAAAPAP